tara:strand:- start:1247 stop:3847 length:2601 start_codon:yes stop_codon:yes gene_type:complete
MAEEKQLEKETILRFEDQCFLMDALKLFSDENIAATPGYKNFIPLVSGGHNIASLVSKVNSRFDKKQKGRGLNAFLGITPAERSALVPKIKLYAIKYKSQDDPNGHEQELSFKDWTQKSSIKKIMSTRQGRGEGAGLVKFSYEFDGKDPATTENLIKASLTLLFTDFNVITKPIRGLNSAERKDFKSGKPGKEKTKENASPRFLDLVTRYTPDNPNSVFTKLKAIIGWSVPDARPGGTVVNSTLKKYINDGHLDMHLILYMTGHDLNFREDGRIEMTVDFRAAIENTLAGADILSLDGEENMIEMLEKKKKRRKEKAERTQAKIKETKKVIEKKVEIAEAKGIEAKYEEAGSDKRMEDATKELKNLDRIFNNLKLRVRTQRYRKMMDRIQQSGKIRYVDLNYEALRKWQGAEGDTAMSEQAEGSTASFSDARSGGAAGRTTARDVLKASNRIKEKSALQALYTQTSRESVISDKAGKDTSAARASQAAQDSEKTVHEEDHDPSTILGANRRVDSGTSHGTGWDTNPDTYRIDYVFLGDILDIACSSLSNQKKWNGITRVVCGPVEFDSPSDDTDDVKIVNLADIPISLTTFSGWYYEKLIAAGRNEYPLKDFISDLTSDLVYRALGDSCFAGHNRMPSLYVTPLILNLQVDGRVTVEPIKKAKGIYKRIDIGSFAKQVKNKLKDKKSTNTCTYIFITGILKDENEFNKGNSRKDKEDGIYHFGIGHDRGIVNTIKFKKVNMKYRKEALVLDQGNIGTGQLREKYDADVSMVGNTLFRNGQYLYLNAATMGLSSSEAVNLGLGGYYVITKVEGELSADGYETNLTCKYNSSGITSKKASAPAKKSSPSTAEKRDDNPIDGKPAVAGE